MIPARNLSIVDDVDLPDLFAPELTVAQWSKSFIMAIALTLASIGLLAAELVGRSPLLWSSDQLEGVTPLSGPSFSSLLTMWQVPRPNSAPVAALGGPPSPATIASQQ